MPWSDCRRKDCTKLQVERLTKCATLSVCTTCPGCGYTSKRLNNVNGHVCGLHQKLHSHRLQLQDLLAPSHVTRHTQDSPIPNHQHDPPQPGCSKRSWKKTSQVSCQRRGLPDASRGQTCHRLRSARLQLQYQVEGQRKAAPAAGSPENTEILMPRLSLSLLQQSEHAQAYGGT